MASVEIAIRSIFEDDGVIGAQRGLSQLIGKLDEMDRAFAESNESLENFISRQELLDSGVFQRMVDGAGQVVPAIKELEVQWQELNEIALSAQATGRPDMAIKIQKEAQAVEQLIQQHLKLVTTLDKEGKAQRVLTQFDFKHAIQGAQNAGQLTTKIQQLQRALKATATEAANSGDIIKLMVTSESIGNLRSFIDQLIKLDGISKETRKQLTGMKASLDKLSSAHRDTNNTAGQFLQTINRLGFSLFIVKSSFQTFITLFKDFGNAMKSAAAQASLVQAFDKAVNAAGGNAKVLSEAFKNVSAGLLDTNKTMEATLRLVKAGVPEFEAVSARMAGLAINASKVGGELEDVDDIYDKLVTGIVKKQPLLIDNAGIIIGLSEAYDDYAEAIGKSSEALTESEKQAAVIAALEDEAILFEDLAAAIGDTPVEPILRVENAIRDLGRSALAAGGIISGQLAQNIVESFGLVPEQFDTIEDKIAAAEQTAAEFEERLGELRTTISEFRAGEDIGERGFLFSSDTLDEVNEFIKGLSLAEKIQVRILQGWFIIRNAVGAVAHTMGITLAAMAGVVDFFMTNFENIARQIQDTIEPASNFMRAVLERDFDAIKDSGEELWNAMSESGDESMENLRGSLSETAQHMQNEFNKALDAAQNISAGGFLEATVDALEDTGIILDELPPKWAASAEQMSAIESVIAELEIALGDNAKFLRDAQKVWDDHAEKVVEINEKLTEKLLELFDDRRKKLLENWEDFNESMLEIAEDLEDDLEDLEEDFDVKREKANKKNKKKKEKLEEDHQKKIDQIISRFELSRLKALIDRDARALFEAQQKRDEDLKNAQDDFEQKKQEEEKRNKEALEELDRQEEKKRQRLEEAAAKAEADAEKRRIKEEQEIREWYAEQVAIANKAAIDQEQDAKDSAQRRIDDMAEALAERRATEELEQALRDANRLKEITNEGEFVVAMETLWLRLESFYIEHPIFPQIHFPNMPSTGAPGAPGSDGEPVFPLPGGGGNGDGSNGAPNCVVSFPGIITPGLDCGGWGEGTTIRDEACIKYTCIDGVWARALATAPITEGFPGGLHHPPPPPGKLHNNNNLFANGGNGGNDNTESEPVKVVIDVTNDRTLEQIFNEMTYSAIVDVSNA